MKADMAVENLHHEGIEGTPACGDGMQDVRAISFVLDGRLDGFDLPAQPANSIEHFLLVANDMSQVATLPIIVYPPYVYRRRPPGPSEKSNLVVQPMRKLWARLRAAYLGLWLCPYKFDNSSAAYWPLLMINNM